MRMDSGGLRSFSALGYGEAKKGPIMRDVPIAFGRSRMRQGWSDIRQRWEKLRSWQKGALLGGGGHLALAAVILIAYFIVVVTDKPGNGDMNLIVFVLGLPLLYLFMLLELIPSYLFPSGLADVPSLLTDPHDYSWTQWAWLILYLVYASVVYALLGTVFGQAVELLRGVKKGANR